MVQGLVEYKGPVNCRQGLLGSGLKTVKDRSIAHIRALQFQDLPWSSAPGQLVTPL